MKEQKYKKVYLRVLAEFDPDGLIVPVAFTWIDGRKFNIAYSRLRRPAGP